jgi:winged helix DNA-binding protein
VTADVLSDRALNRATLGRQLLLERAPMPPLDAVTYLVGLQAQNPLDPYLALWSRLSDLDPHVLARAMEDREVVRIVVMRGTIHLVTAADALALAPVMQPVMDAEIARHSEYAPHLRDVDVTPVVAYARDVLAERPRTMAQLRVAIAERFPDVHPAAAAYATRCLVPLVQVPPRGVWGRKGQVTVAPAATWLADHPASTTTIDEVVVRYLTAFGPATVADIAAWCRLTAMREVVDRLGPRLRTFRDERGRTYHDVPDGPLADADTPAPVRLLPEYDNAVLSYADRSRFGAEEDRAAVGAAAAFKGLVLVDGCARGVWKADRPARRDRGSLVVEHLPLSREHAAELEAEAHALARFWFGTGAQGTAANGSAADDVDVRLVPLS